MSLKKIRKLVALFRGQISPVLAGIAVGLGFWFGLIPGFSGIHAVILIALVLLNVPVGLFLLFAGLGKTLCLAAAPALYHAGLYIQDHMAWMLQTLGSIPIIGLTNFNRPAVAGSIIIGPVCGIIFGLIVGYMILGFRKTWFKLENGSEKFAQWQSKRYVKIMDRILIGKRAKDAKTALEAKTVYLRKAGAALAVLILAIFIALTIFAKDSLISNMASNTLTSINGATVDIESLSLSPASGKVSISAIGMTDREIPSQNKVQIAQIAAKANVYDLSVGRLVMDEVLVSDVKFDQKRETPGQVIEKTEQTTSEQSEQTDSNIDNVDLGTLDKYFTNAKKIKEWIDKIRNWIPQSEKNEEEPAVPHKYLDYLTAVSDRSPTVKMLAKKIIADKVELAIDQFGLSTITVANVSNAPAAAGLPVEIDIQSQSGGAHVNLIWHFEANEEPGKISGMFDGIDMGLMQSAMNSGNAMQFSSGKASGTIEGQLTDNRIDLSLKINIKDLQANAGGKGLFGLDQKTSAEVLKVMNNLDLTMQIVGPVTDPKIVFDSESLNKTFKDKLEQAGKARLAEEVDKQLEKNLGDKIPGELKDIIKTDDLGNGLKNLLGGGKDKK